MTGILIILMGLFAGWIAGVFNRVPNSQKTKGTVVEVVYGYDKFNRREKITATIEYIVNNQKYTMKSKTVSMATKCNHKKTIKYNRDNPEIAVVCPEFSSYIIMFIIIIFGIYILLKEYIAI